ncbi:hypothetical protein F4803DRAFT_570531 [Xylaria telfairii]|nr:hypothetical protein F4803DRAFT_570531 [Xylaria telfairii]
MSAPVSRSREPLKVLRKGEGDDANAKKPSVPSGTQSEPIGAITALANNISSSQENTTLVSQTSGNSCIPSDRIRRIIMETHIRIHGQAKSLVGMIEVVRDPRMHGFLPSLKRCLRSGLVLESLLKQDCFNLGEFHLVGERLDYYVRDLEGVVREIQLLLRSHWAVTISIRSSAEAELRKATCRLERTLQEVSPTIEILSLWAQAGTYQEIKLRDELKQMKEKLVSAKQELASLNRPTTFHSPPLTRRGSDEHASRSREKMPETGFDMKYLERLAYLPSRPYQNMPGAYTRRHECMKKYLATESARWFTYNEKFREWVANPKLTLFSCEGPRGVGKSVIAARVIDWLQLSEFQGAYFYFGIGKVQTAAGVALALLSQLCMISGHNPSFLDLSHAAKRLKTTLEVNEKLGTGPTRRGPTWRTKSICYGNTRTRLSLPTTVLNVSGDREISRTSTLLKLPPPVPSSHTPTQTSLGRPDLPHMGLGTGVSSYLPDFQGMKTETRELGDLGGDRDQFHFEAEEDELFESIKEVDKEGTYGVPELSMLIKALHTVSLQFDDRPFIVLDGWDEDNMIIPAEFSILLKALEEDGYKIFLTSRSAIKLSDEASAIRMSLHGGTEMPLQWADIVSYVRELLSGIRESNRLIVDDSCLATSIADLSDGVFDYAKILTLQYIYSQNTLSSKFTFKLLRDIAQNGDIMPNALYNIRHAKTKRATYLLMTWILVSPVPLTKEMLSDAFSAIWDNWKRTAGRETGPELDVESQKGPSLDTVLECCEPFVSVDHGNDLVQFTSTMAKRIFYQGTPHTTQRELAIAVVMTSLAYLGTTEDLERGCCATEEELAELLKNHPFLYQSAYLSNYLALIAEDDSRGSRCMLEQIIELLNSPKRFLIMQVFLYTREDDQSNEISLSWDKSILFIRSMSKLHVAALWGQLKLVTAFLEEDKDSATWTNVHDSRPLHEAAKSGVIEVIQAVLDANPRMACAIDEQGKTPLFYAWQGDHREAIVILFQAQCAYQTLEELRDIDGNDINFALRRYCLEKSGLEDSIDKDRCMGVAMVRAIKEGLVDVAELLITQGANLNEVDDGVSALYTVVEQGNDNLAAVLISKGADPTVGVPEGKEPLLHVLVRKRMEKALLRLLRNVRSIDVNCKDSKGRTALFSAAEVGDETWAVEVMNLLLWRGLDIDLLDTNDNHIMHIVAEKGYTIMTSEVTIRSRLVEELKNKTNRTPFDIARELHHEEIATFIRPTYKLSKRYH